MYKNNHPNHLENHDLDNFSKTGYSNSRLDAHTVCISDPKLSFDAMMIIGSLNRDNAQALSKFMSVEPQIKFWDTLQTKFKAKALQGKVYIEHGKVRADNWDRCNMRIEFSPNKLTRDEMIWLKQNIISCMEDDGFIRLDLTFDSEDDLSDYYTISGRAVKKTIFYGRNGKLETEYFGIRDSNRSIRIYNKKRERKDNADTEVMSEHLWHVEVELKRDMVGYWNDCSSDLHILQPDWKAIQRTADRVIVLMLLSDEEEWGRLRRNSRAKHKNLMKEISPVDLTDLTKSTLRANEKQLQKQIDFW